MKDQEKEIEALKQELEKEKKLNQTLAKVIGFLKERLDNNKQPKQEAVTSNLNSEKGSSTADAD